MDNPETKNAEPKPEGAGGSAGAQAPAKGETSANDIPGQSEPAPPKSDLNTPEGSLTFVDPSPSPSTGKPRRSSIFPRHHLQPGDIFGGRYEIVKVLGEGGMGTVYKAHDREVDQFVALKLIRPEMASRPAILARFKQELLTARQVTHRNVIRIYELSEIDGVKFITMEFVEGCDLHRLLREKGKLSPEQAVEIIRQVSLALEAAHGAGVIHRDLKPQNIMQDNQGRVLVMDFGLARSLESDGMTRTGALLGTMEYMSPEQALGKQLDARSDLFAVGLVFFELLTGNTPFKADTAMASLLKRNQERAVPAMEVDGSIPKALSDIVGKCLERDLELRYQNVQEIQADLDAWQGRRPVLASVMAAAPTPQRAVHWKWIAAGTLAAAIITGLGFFLRQKFAVYPVSKHRPVSLLIADFKNGTGDSLFDGTLEPVFSTALEAAPFISTYRRASAHRLAKQLQPEATGMDESLARLVAVREGVEVVVSGSISRGDDGFHLSARAVDSNSGKPIAAREVAVTNKDAVLAAIGKLATPIRNQLGDTTPESAQLAAEESFTTSSLEAAHWYSLGQDAIERGQLDLAIQNYGKAVQFDPNMGRAWAGMAVASVNLKKTSDADKYYKKTLSLLDRMSERERYRTLGTYYAAFVRNFPQAIETYQKLVFLYPGDGATYNNLSIAYVFMLDFPKAIAAVRHALDINPHKLEWRLNYALYSMYASDFATAASVSERIIQENPSYQFAYLPLAISTLARGDADSARAIYARLGKVSPNVFSVARMGEADLEMYFGHNKRALDILSEGIQADEKDKRTGEMALKLVAEGEAYLALGRKSEAVKAARKVPQLNSDESAAYPAARVLIQAGDDDEARKIASALDNTLQTQSRSYSRLIAGEIDILHKQLPQAVDELQQGQKLRNSWISHFLLGRAYIDAQHYPEALNEFEACKERRGETTDLMLADTATLRYLPPLYYWLARAQDGAGMKSAALENYQQFLKLRADSDPGDPLVIDASRRAGSAPQ
jgi:tetratricopeptide (TPR) repeat protein/predicted Ser/Thr protein kinase